MKICVAEDEVKVRESIVRKLNRLPLSLQVFDSGYGKDALNTILQIRPQVVLTDILMPGLNGLELLQAIRQQLPAAQVVLLTGYSDFDYAQKAVKYGAFDYLLKPVDNRQLEEVLGRIRQQFTDELLAQLKPLQHQLSASGTLMSAIQAQHAEIWFDERTAKKIMLTDDPSAITLEAERAPNTILFSFQLDHKYYGLLQQAAPGEASSFTDQEQFPASLIEEKQRLETKLFLHRPNAASNHQMSRHHTNVCKALRPKVLRAAGLMDSTETARCLQQWFEAAELLMMKDIQTEAALLMAVLDEGLVSGKQPKVIDNDKLDYWLKWVRQWQHWPELKAKLHQFIAGGVSALAELDRRRSSTRPSLVKQAEEIIKQAEGTISLETVAAKLHVHPVALSRMFKQETGTAFIHWATSLRMQHAAKLLLETDRRVADIASESGYQDSKYFSQLFRKAYGCTPGEYRKRQM